MARGEIKALLFDDGVSVGSTPTAPSSFFFSLTDSTNWNDVQTQVSYNVAAGDDNGNVVTEARVMLWTLYKGSTRQRMDFDLDFPDATHVRITVGIPLAAGTYYLVGR